MNSRVVKFLLITLYLLSFTPTYAAELSPVYPPYPDVWGYDFSSRPETRIVNVLLSVYKIENGDYWFKIWDSVTRDLTIENGSNITKTKSSMYEFFAQKMHANYQVTDYTSKDTKITNFKENGSDRVIKYTFDKNRLSNLNQWKIVFSNGESLEIDTKSTRDGCWDTDIKNISFLKTDKNGNEIDRYAIIVANPYATPMEPYEDYHELNSCGANNDKEVLAQVHPIAGGMILLKDDTFLLYGSHFTNSDSIIIRFKQDLTTPYSPDANYKMYNGKIMTKKVFVIPYQIIRSLEIQAYRANQPTAQALQNRLIDFLADDYPLLAK